MEEPSQILSSFSDLADGFSLTALIHTEQLQVLLANAKRVHIPLAVSWAICKDDGPDIELSTNTFPIIGN